MENSCFDGGKKERMSCVSDEFNVEKVFSYSNIGCHLIFFLFTDIKYVQTLWCI
jgi:hypothetical protein